MSREKLPQHQEMEEKKMQKMRWVKEPQHQDSAKNELGQCALAH